MNILELLLKQRKWPPWGGGQSSEEERKEGTAFTSCLNNSDVMCYDLVKIVEAATCKDEAAIRVMLSAEMVRMILLRENCRLI